MDSLLEAMLQGFVNKAIGEKLRSGEFENRLTRLNEQMTSSPGHVTRMTETMLNSRDFTAQVAAVVKKETEKAVNVEWKREIRHCKFFASAYSTAARSASSSNHLLTDISDKRTNQKA